MTYSTVWPVSPCHTGKATGGPPANGKATFLRSVLRRHSSRAAEGPLRTADRAGGDGTNDQNAAKGALAKDKLMSLGVSVQSPPTELINRTHQTLEAAGSFQGEASVRYPCPQNGLLDPLTLEPDTEPSVRPRDVEAHGTKSEAE